MQERKKQAWGSRIGLILAMAGSAVGLGNFVRFPIQAIQNGGGAFIIPYLVSFLLMGIPLSLIEWSTGKYGGLAGKHSPPMITYAVAKKKAWKYIGVMGIFSSFIISAYYCYIESWTLTYTFHSLLSTFTGMTEEDVSNFFLRYLDLHESTLGIPYENVFFFIVCVIINVFILSLGIKNGIEKVSKWMMPTLFLLGLVLVYKAFTLKAGQEGALYDGLMGFDFLWYPQFDSLSNPKVWLAAAGQVFFTMSLGMGALQCYSSYMRAQDDVALNSITAAFTNEFAEVILGSSIIIPIAIGYFGIDQTIAMTENGGLGLGFRVLPYLFSQWGQIWSIIAGFSFFGLLFFASITSCLSISTPTFEFLTCDYGYSRTKSAIIFGIMLTAAGLPTVLFFNQGVFDEYDYWGGTISLFVGGMTEAIMFGWVIGADKGWKMINSHADIHLPRFFVYILRYVTPTILIVIFVSALIKPEGGDWSKLSFKGWELDNSSVLAQLQHKGIGPNNTWTADHFYAENSGKVESVTENTITISGKTYTVQEDCTADVKVGDNVACGDPIYSGSVVNNVCYVDLTRIGLVLFLIILCLLVANVSDKAKDNPALRKL